MKTPSSTRAARKVKQVRRATPAAKTTRTKKRGFALRTILVPTDFSSASTKALRYARALGEEFDSTFHLLNVFDGQLEPPLPAPLFGTDQEIATIVRRELRALGEKAGLPMDRSHCHMRIGPAYRQVCEEAAKVRADLIVIATRGAGGWKRVLIGSTAERVVRHAPCPVLVVREKEREFISRKSGKQQERTLKIRRIVVPTDFSAHSKEALDYAIALAKRVGARLLLVNATYPQYLNTSIDYMALDYPALYEDIRSRARSEMKEFLRGSAFQGVPFDTAIKDGHPAERIVRFAKKERADLIVTSTHGRTGFSRALLGSTAEQVVRHARCPVLVVPPPGAVRHA
ncbi:universal stress protein [soil metagenome]